MTRKKMLIVLVAAVILLVLYCMWLIKGRKELDYESFFESNVSLFQAISDELLELNFEGEIRLQKNKRLSIKGIRGQLNLEDNEQVEKNINALFSLKEIWYITVQDGYVQYTLRNPPKNYRGWYVYDPQNTFWGGIDMFTKRLTNEWILEIMPNT